MEGGLSMGHRYDDSDWLMIAVMVAALVIAIYYSWGVVE